MRAIEKMISQQSASSRPVFSLNKSSRLGVSRPLLGAHPLKGTSLLNLSAKSISHKGVEEEHSHHLSSEAKEDVPSREQYTLDGVENQNVLLESDEDVIHLHAVKNSVVLIYVIKASIVFIVFIVFIV